MVSPVEPPANPFTERDRIIDPQHFIGRWRELSVIFDRLAVNSPVLIAGPTKIGKSSLLTHITQSGGVNLENPELRSFYVDLSVLPDAAACYELIVRALGSTGNTPAALEVALIEADYPVLLCLDNVETAMATGWGERMLETLARMTRRSRAVATPTAALPYTSAQPLLLVAAMRSPVPTLSEPFATVTLSALSLTEARLFVDTYLGGTDIAFTAQEVRDLNTLSGGHPAYFQRAAYHLFIAKTQPGYNWRTAYLAEAQDRPIPGAPLPPGAFESTAAHAPEVIYNDSGVELSQSRRSTAPHIEGQGGLFGVLLLIIAAFLALQLSGSWLVAGIVLLGGIGVFVVIERGRT